MRRTTERYEETRKKVSQNWNIDKLFEDLNEAAKKKQL